MQRIMIIADLEDKSQIALIRGLALADKLNMSAEVIGFCYEYLTEFTAPVRKQIKAKSLAKKQAWLDAEVKRQAPDGLKVKTRVIWEKNVHEWVTKRCDQKDYYAVIKTAHRSGSFLYTSTDWHLLRECPAPVLIEAEKKWNKARPIVASLDLETHIKFKRHLNDRIIKRAIALAKATDSELHVVYAMSIPTLLRDMDLINVDEHVLKRRKKLRPVIDQLCIDYGLSRKNVHLKPGAAAKVIPSLANKLKADLVVMGTVGRRGLRGKLMGNTAEKVLQYLRTDVLAIK